MARVVPLLVLLVGCATPEPPKPLTAMEVYQKIRERLMAAPVVTVTGTVDGPFTAILATGNRTRIRHERYSTVRITNGTESAWFSGAMPHVGEAEAGFEREQRANLLRGLPPGSYRDFYRYTRDLDGKIMGYRAGSWSQFTGVADARVSVESATVSTLTFLAFRPEDEPPLQYSITIRFDPATYDPRSLQTALVQPEGEFIRVQFDLRLDQVAQDQDFIIPENPMIRINRAEAELSALKDALEQYAMDNHAYPTTDQGLEALRREPVPKPRNWKGPYIGESAPTVDPWDHPYEYRSPRRGINPRGFDLSSWGYDGKPNTSDDLKR